MAKYSNNPGSLISQTEAIRAAIAAQETLRPTLGDAVVNSTVAALREKLAQLEGEQNRRLTGDETIPPELSVKMRASIPQRGERRRVTVLFADISGFTELGEILDLEEIASFTDEVLRSLAQAVYQEEGYVDKFIGDKIMAVFGAPVAHEDDASRALRAALLMRSNVDALSLRWRQRLGRAIKLHAGINTGMVVADSFGSDLRLRYTVIGDTVNVAARLESAAAPGQILVSRAVADACSGDFLFGEIPAVRAKGKRNPIPAFELIRHRITKDRRAYDDSLIGRSQELSFLEQRTSELLEGQGCTIAIVGNAGVGKTRLIEAWKSRAGENVKWLEGRSYPHTSSQAYSTLQDMVRRIVNIDSDINSATARCRLERKFLPYIEDPGQFDALANLLGLRPPPSKSSMATLSAEERRSLTHQALERVLDHTARQNPTVLHFEDLHWADASTIDTIERMMEDACLPCILLCSYRPDQSEHHRAKLLRMERSSRTHVVELDNMSIQDCGEIVRSILGSPPPLGVCDSIYARSEGNPFYTIELCRALIESGHLWKAGSEWGFRTSDRGLESIPGTLHSLVMARLDRLQPETKWLAQQASVVGRVFIRRILEMLEEQQHALELEIEELCKSHVVRACLNDSEQSYMFEHAISQEVAYESLLESCRRDLHLKVGEAIETLFEGRIDEVLDVLGGHFLRARSWGKAFQYLTKAADYSVSICANIEARDLYSRAYRAASMMEDSAVATQRRVDVICRLLQLRYYSSQEDCESLLHEAESGIAVLEQKYGEPVGIRHARVKYLRGGFYYMDSRLDLAHPILRETATIAESSGDSDLAAQSLGLIGRLDLCLGNLKGSADNLQASIALSSHESGDRRQIAVTTACLALVRALSGDRAASEAGLDHAYDIASTTAMGAQQGIRQCESVHLILFGDYERSREVSNVIIGAAEALQEKLSLYMGLFSRGWAACLSGDFVSGGADLDLSLDIARSTSNYPLMLDWLCSLRAWHRLCCGKYQESITLALQALDLARTRNALIGTGVAHRVLALAESELRHDHESEFHIQESISAFERGGVTLEEIRTRIIWAEMRVRRGEKLSGDELHPLSYRLLKRCRLTSELDRLRLLSLDSNAQAPVEDGDPGAG